MIGLELLILENVNGKPLGVKSVKWVEPDLEISSKTGHVKKSDQARPGNLVA